MTHKIMIVGSSHVAALRNAATTVMPRHPEITLDFFAAPGPLFRKFGFDPETKQIGALKQNDFSKKEIELLEKINGRKTAEFEGYDAIVLVGHDVKETLNARILSRFSIDGARDAPLERRMSAAAYRAALEDLGRSTLPAPAWWHWDSPQLFVSPAPRIAENCTSVGSRTVASWVPLVEKQLTTPASFADYIHILENIYAAHGMQLIPTPDDAYGPLGLTKTEYSEGAVYIQPGEHRDNFDAKHMNASFGLMCLENIIQTVKKKCP